MRTHGNRYLAGALALVGQRCGEVRLRVHHAAVVPGCAFRAGPAPAGALEPRQGPHGRLGAARRLLRDDNAETPCEGRCLIEIHFRAVDLGHGVG